jgi:GT2 family glycosyltransferase
VVVSRIHFSAPVRWRAIRHPRRAAIDAVNVVRRRLGLAPLSRERRVPRPALSRPVAAGLFAYVEERHGAGIVPLLRRCMAFATRPGEAAVIEQSEELAAFLAEVRLAAAAIGPRPVDVSIIIPVRDALAPTLACLAALLAMPTRYGFEILIGDDASGVATRTALAGIGGPVRHILHPANLGFLRNCNAVAAAARGRHLVFLNNDTVVLPGWLDALIDTLEEDPTVAVAGSKLLNADGTLQEAGGIIWRDGSGWNLGRGQDPRAPEFNFVRETDYCSGASLAVPAAVWRRLGGFDERYAPAYFEDSDFAFRARAAGFRVIYQPFSEIIHHEGLSHGRDPRKGIKAWQVRNRDVFVDRWRQVLAREHFTNGESVFVARDRSRERPHVLFFDHYVPQPDRDAGSRTIFDFMRTFQERGFRVTLWPENQHYDRPYVERLQRMGIEVVYALARGRDPATWLGDAGKALDYVFLSRPQVARHFIAAVRRNTRAKVLFYGHDLHWQRLELEYRATGNPALPAHIRHLHDLEIEMCRAADAVFYPSETECAVVRREVDTPVFMLPMAAYDTRDRERGDSAVDVRHLLFVGGFAHTPNVDGVEWFIAKIWPELLRRDSRLRLTIAGSNPPQRVLALADAAVTVTGWLSADDLAALYARVGVAVVPLRFGGGVKGKVLEAFAAGVSVVATSVGVQGIPDAGSLAFVADEPAAFAVAVLAAISDRETAERKCVAARDFMQRQYSTAGIAAALSVVVPELLDTTKKVKESSI